MNYEFDVKSLTAKVINFKDCTEKNIIVPDRILYEGRDYVVTEIGDRSFKECTSIQSIVIPSSVIKIGEFAFSGCRSLQDIVIPASVTEIGNGAFDGCTALQSIEIPASVKKNGAYAFYGCTDLQSIVVSANNPVYDSRDNSNAIIEIKSNKLVVGCRMTVIPESITEIGNNAFSGCSTLRYINIPESVKRIWGYAFSGLKNLKSIAILNLAPPEYAESEYDIPDCYPPCLYVECFDINIAKCTLYIPQEAVEKYSTREPWCNFREIKGLEYNSFYQNGSKYIDKTIFQ